MISFTQWIHHYLYFCKKTGIMFKLANTLFLLMLTFPLLAQGTDFFEGTWEEAIVKARKENKILFVDAHTSWCSPCRRLKRDVFPLKEVGDYLRRDFIPLAMDLETPRGLLFSLYYKVKGYPSFLFIDSNGRVIHRTLGYRNPDQLMKDGNRALEKRKGDPGALKTNWAQRKQNIYFIKEYIDVFRVSGQPIAPIVFDYLAEAKLSEKEKLTFIFEELDGVSSPLMDELLKENHLSTLDDTLGGAIIEEKIIELWMQEMDATIKNGSRKKAKTLQKRSTTIPYVTQTHFDTYKKYLTAVKKEKFDKVVSAASSFFNLLPSDNLKRKFLLQLFNKQIKKHSLNPTVLALAKQLHEQSDTLENAVLLVEFLILNGQYQAAQPLMNQTMEAAMERDDYKTLIELTRYDKYLRKKLTEKQ